MILVPMLGRADKLSDNNLQQNKDSVVSFIRDLVGHYNHNDANNSWEINVHGYSIDAENKLHQDATKTTIVKIEPSGALIISGDDGDDIAAALALSFQAQELNNESDAVGPSHPTDAENIEEVDLLAKSTEEPQSA